MSRSSLKEGRWLHLLGEDEESHARLRWNCDYLYYWQERFWRLGSMETLRVTICLDLCRHIVCSGIDTTELFVVFVFVRVARDGEGDGVATNLNCWHRQK